jgi:hypothetical protein
MYVFGDERDLVRLRTEHRKDTVYVYPLRGGPKIARAMLVDILARVNSLHGAPEFYNSLTNTCTTNIVEHANRIAPGLVPLSWQEVLPGHSDARALELGLIDFDGTIEAARERFRVNERAAQAAGAFDFSERIRRMPGQPTREPRLASGSEQATIVAALLADDEFTERGWPAVIPGEPPTPEQLEVLATSGPRTVLLSTTMTASDDYPDDWRHYSWFHPGEASVAGSQALIDRALRSDLIAANLDARPLPQPAADAPLFPRDEYDRLVEPTTIDGDTPRIWAGVRSRVPSAWMVVQVSWAVLSPDGARAVLYADADMDAPFGCWGSLYLLERRGATWVVIASEIHAVC